MEELPYADQTFDVVTGFSAFQFAANPVTALQEASRVSRTGIVVIAVFGKPEESESTAILKALAPLLPPQPAGAPGPYALSADGAVEALAIKAGLTPTVVKTVACPFNYRDRKPQYAGMLSSGPAVHRHTEQWRRSGPRCNLESACALQNKFRWLSPEQ